MDTNPQQQKRRDRALSSLNAAIKAVDLAKDAASATPAAPVFGPVSTLLTTIRVRSILFSDLFQAHT